MKTMEQLYQEILANEELKSSFVQAVRTDTVAGFLQEQGCTATVEEAKEFIAAQKEQQMGMISDDELENVSDGCGSSAPGTRGNNLVVAEASMVACL